MNEHDALELQRRRLVDEVRDSVEKQLLRRYSWAGAVVAAIAGLLVTLTVRDLLSDSRVELAAAQKVQEDTTTRLLDATEASTILSAKTEDSIEEFHAIKDSVEKRLQELSTQASSLRSSLSRESTSTLKISGDMNAKIQRLTKVVTNLSEKVAASDVERVSLAETLGAIDRSLDKSADTIAAASRTAELSEYFVVIHPGMDGSHTLANDLRVEGFDVSELIGKGGDSKRDHNAAVIGTDLPYQIATRLLRATKELLPEVNKLVRGKTFPKRFDIGYVFSSDDKSRTVTEQEFRDLVASNSDAEFAERLESLKSYEW